MAGLLTSIYSIAVLLLVLVGIAFVFTVTMDGSQESRWSLGGELAAVAIFLVAMVASLL
ncbi:MAG: hypothetical protein ABEH78_08270 [Haloferacaceae archaeon]